MLPILCFLGIYSFGVAQPVKDWDFGYGGDGWEDCNAAIETTDLGFLLGGITSSDANGDVSQPTRDDPTIPWWIPNTSGDYWVLRTDINGEDLWEARFGGNKEDRLWGLEQTSDGGFILGGQSYSDISGEKSDSSRGHSDYWIVKIDTAGVYEWDKTFGGDSTDILNVLIQTQDGGYMLGGWSISSGWTATDTIGEKSAPSQGDFDWWIVKIDADGTLEWEKSFGGSDTEQLADIVQKEDGSYILAGGTDSPASGDVDSVSRGSRDYWVLHIDEQGNKLQEFRYGGDDFDDLNKIIITRDGGYMLAGSSFTVNISGDKTDPGFGSIDWWVLKINSAGAIQWQHTFGGSDLENVYSLSQNSVDHYLLGGLTRSIDGTLADNPTKGEFDYWIMYLDPDGNRLWDERYGGNDSESCEQIFQTSDGGYLMAGHSRTDQDQDKTDPTNGLNDFWIVKTLCDINVELTDTIVCPNQDVTLSAYDPNCIDCIYSWSDLGNTTDSVRVIQTDALTSYAVTLTDGVGCQRDDEIIVDVYTPPEVNLGTSDPLCQGETLSLDAGADGIDYAWSTNDSVQMITVDTSATYAVTVTDANNCATQDSITVVVNPLPIVDLGMDTVLCDGEALTINAGNSGADFTWSNTGNNAQTISVSNSDLYSVTVTDVNDCTSTDAIGVNFLPLPQPVELDLLDPGPHCPGTSFSLSIQNSENNVLYVVYDSADSIMSSNLGNGGLINFSTNQVFSTTTFSVYASSTGLCADTLDGTTTANIGDIEAPIIDCRSDTVIIIEDGNCDPILSIGAPASFSDNCGIESLIYSMSGATNSNSPLTGLNDASGETFSVGLTTVTYTAIDSFGNNAFCSFNVEVVDQTQPLVGTQATSLLVECDGSGNTMSFNNWLASNGGATAFDACSSLSWTTIPANPVLSDGCGETGTIEVTFVASDTSGNSVFTVGSFTIQDTQAPTFTVPADITIGPADDVMDLSITGDVIDETDACDGSVNDQGLRFATYTDVVAIDDCVDVITRTWSLTDECGNNTEQIQLITQEFAPPSGSLTGAAAICPGDMVDLTFALTGTGGTFNVVYNDGQNITLNGISDGHTIQVTPNETTNYTIVSLIDVSRPDCQGTIVDDVEIIVNEAPEIINIVETCNLLNTNYTISFEISGGDSDSYFVNGDGGVLTGNDFVSITIPKDSSYTFIIDDANGCGPFELSGSYDCECVTDAGTLQETSLIACGTETIIANHEGSTLDGNDLIEFVVHDGDANTIGDILYTTNVPEFAYQGNMQYGVTYFITIIAGTDNGAGEIANVDACLSESIGIPIIFHEPPTAVITPTTDTELDCIETSLHLSGMDSQTQGGISFEWSVDGNGNISSGTTMDLVQVDEEGTYILTIMDQATTCTASASIEISIDENAPQAEIDPALPLTCADTIVQLNASGSSTGSNFVYQWSGGTILSGDQSLNPMVSESTTYTLFVTDTLNNCTTSTTIFVETDYDAPIVNAGPVQQLDCINTEVTLNGSYTAPTNNVMIEWVANSGNIMSGGNTLNPTVDAGGTYTLIVTNQDNGCSSTSNVSVTVDPSTPQGADLEAFDPDCFGDENGSISIVDVVGGTAPFTYAINSQNFITENEFNNLAPGQYDVTIKDALGCEWDTLITLQTPLELIVDLGDNIEINLGDSIELDAFVNQPIDTFVWNVPELISMNPTVRPANQVTYVLQVTNESGCQDEDFVTIVVRKDRNVYIPTAFSPNDDGANDYFSIYSDQSVVNIRNFRIFDRWGETVFATENILPNIPNQGWNGRFKNQEMQQGVYIFFAEIEFFDGRVEIFKGDITLLR